MIKSESNLPQSAKAGNTGLVNLERILMVDDEELLTRMWAKILGREGYQITVVNSPDEAIKLFAAAPGNFDLVITDLAMPQMTGDILGKTILAIRPDIPVILFTGYASKIEKDRSIADSFSKIIFKPAKIAELTAAIREALLDKKQVCC